MANWLLMFEASDAPAELTHGLQAGTLHTGRMKTAINKPAAVRRKRETEAYYGPTDRDTGSGETASQGI